MFSINQVQLKERVRSDIALEQLKAQIMVLPALKDVRDCSTLSCCRKLSRRIFVDRFHYYF